MSWFLGLGGLVLMLEGLRALFTPRQAVLAPMGLQAAGPDGLSFVRAGAGGVTLACGGLLLAGAIWPSLARPALILAVVVLGGMVLGRVVSWRVDGRPGRPLRVALAVEALASAVATAFLLLGP